MRKVFRPLRRATRAPPWTCRPLKRAALNFTPFVTQTLSWVLPGVLTAFCPKCKIAPCNLGRGDFYLPPSTASDSRHNLGPDSTFRRGAPGRVCPRALARRKIAPHATWQWVISTFRPLLHPTPGTIQVLAQPLGAERRGGCACGRRAAGGLIFSHNLLYYIISCGGEEARGASQAPGLPGTPQSKKPYPSPYFGEWYNF